MCRMCFLHKSIECSWLSRWKIIARLSVLLFAVCLGFIPSNPNDVSVTEQYNKQQKTGKAPQTLSEITSLWYWHYVNLRVPNDVQRKIQVKLKQPNSGVRSFHSITAKHHKWLIMGTKAAQTDYVHTHVIKVTYMRTLRVLSGEVFLTQNLFPHLHTVRCVSRRLSASMINESDCVPVFI